MSDLIERSGDLAWLNTDAGHLILLPSRLRSLWSGIQPPKDGRVVKARFRWNKPSDPATDYDRACDVEDYVGILDVGPGKGVVLGQDPLPATWISRPDGGVLIARLYTSEIGMPAAIPTPPSELAWQVVGKITYDDSALVLFDSTEPGDEESAFPSLPVAIVPGRYVVEHARFANADMELWLVRLRHV